MHNLFIGELAERLAKRQVSSVELTRHFLSRIERLNPALNAFVTLTAEHALADAAAADRRLAQGERGPLLGIPLIHKDIFCTDGVKTSCGSRMLDNFVAPYDATVVERMKRAGMVYFPWLYSDQYLVQLVNDADFDRAKMAFGDSWAKTWDANTLVWRYEASRNHDASEPFGGDMKKALSRIDVPVLILSSSSDRTVPAYLTDELEGNLAHVKRVVFQTRNGHLGYLQPAGTSEYEQISSSTREFINSLGE